MRYSRRICGAAALAILTAVVMTAAPQDPAPKEKKMDQPEYDLYDAATKDILANNGAKAVEDLNAWKQKFPTSDYKLEGEVMYVQAYQLNKQFDKVLEKAKELMDQNLDKLFPDPKSGPQASVKILFAAVAAILNIADPSPDQIAIGSKASHQLLEYSRKPEGISDTDWAGARKTLNDASNAALLKIALMPGNQAVAKHDCPAAELAWTKALSDYPDNASISYQLAQAYNCNQKAFLALYEYARAAAIDPSLGKTADAARVSAFVKKTYTTLHGSDEGYDQLLAQAKSSPLPPADFKIVTGDELKAAADEKFAKDNPELAMWKNLKGSLTAQGDAFFQGMKGAELPQLIGVIADAKPACHSKTLTVYVPTPDNTAKTTEITLKFETALSGKPEVGSTIKFVAVGESFTASPFMLTLTAEKDKIQDLKMEPCSAAPAARKGTTKKK